MPRPRRQVQPAEQHEPPPQATPQPNEEISIDYDAVVAKIAHLLKKEMNPYFAEVEERLSKAIAGKRRGTTQKGLWQRFNDWLNKPVF